MSRKKTRPSPPAPPPINGTPRSPNEPGSVDPPSRGRAAEAKRIALAAVAGAHGVKGELRLKLFTDRIDNLKRHEAVYIGGVERKLESVRAGSSGAIARVAGITDRSAAEALRGSLVEVDRSTLPPLEEGEYYHADLIGLACFDAKGNELGRVVGVENYGAGDLLEVETAEGKHSLIPFSRGVAELDGDRVVLDPEFLA